LRGQASAGSSASSCPNCSGIFELQGGHEQYLTTATGLLNELEDEQLLSTDEEFLAISDDEFPPVVRRLPMGFALQFAAT
jgi:hypothetical protein